MHRVSSTNNDEFHFLTYTIFSASLSWSKSFLVLTVMFSHCLMLHVLQTLSSHKKIFEMHLYLILFQSAYMCMIFCVESTGFEELFLSLILLCMCMCTARWGHPTHWHQRVNKPIWSTWQTVEISQKTTEMSQHLRMRVHASITWVRHCTFFINQSNAKQVSEYENTTVIKRRLETKQFAFMSAMQNTWKWVWGIVQYKVLSVNRNRSSKLPFSQFWSTYFTKFLHSKKKNFFTKCLKVLLFSQWNFRHYNFFRKMTKFSNIFCIFLRKLRQNSFFCSFFLTLEYF